MTTIMDAVIAINERRESAAGDLSRNWAALGEVDTDKLKMIAQQTVVGLDIDMDELKDAAYAVLVKPIQALMRGMAPEDVLAGQFTEGFLIGALYVTLNRESE
jgi:hypothetical protein